MARSAGVTAGAAKVAAGYAAVGVAWILGSDRLVAALAADAGEVARMQQGKGIAFVAVTALALFALVRRQLGARERYAQEVRQREELLLQLEHRVQLGLLLGGVAHDLRNHLHVVSLGAAELIELLPAGEAREVAEDVRAAADDGVALTRRLTTSMRRDDAAAPFDPAAVVDAAVTLCRRHPDGRDRHIEVHPTVVPSLVGWAGDFERAAVNLVLNAVQAAGAGGRVRVDLAPTPQGVELRVEDDGPGVPPELADRGFETLYTTKPQGTGLGLTAVRDCAERHGGSLRVERSELGGAAFRLVIAPPP